MPTSRRSSKASRSPLPATAGPRYPSSRRRSSLAAPDPTCSTAAFWTLRARRAGWRRTRAPWRALATYSTSPTRPAGTSSRWMMRTSARGCAMPATPEVLQGRSSARREILDAPTDELALTVDDVATAVFDDLDDNDGGAPAA